MAFSSRGQCSSQQGRHDLVAGAGSWLMTFLFTYRKERERKKAGSGVKCSPNSTTTTEGGHGEYFPLILPQIQQAPKKHYAPNYNCLSECLRTLVPSTHGGQRLLGVGDDEVEQQQLCEDSYQRGVGEAAVLKPTIGNLAYFRNVQVLDIHLVIYTCHEWL